MLAVFFGMFDMIINLHKLCPNASKDLIPVKRGVLLKTRRYMLVSAIPAGNLDFSELQCYEVSLSRIGLTRLDLTTQVLNPVANTGIDVKEVLCQVQCNVVHAPYSLWALKFSRIPFHQCPPKEPSSVVPHSLWIITDAWYG